jgi:biuret amidohydrolase
MAFDMSPLLQPGQVAVLFSEIQRSVIGDAASLGAIAAVAAEVGVIANAARLAHAARASKVPVIHCLANIGPGRFGANRNARLFMSSKRQQDRPPHDPALDAPVPEVFADGDLMFKRDHGLNPMADTGLDRCLRNEGIRTVIVAGVSLNVAIPGMVMDAVNSAYQVIVVRDAVSGFPADYAEPMLNNTLAMLATLATTDEIIAGWQALS